MIKLTFKHHLLINVFILSVASCSSALVANSIMKSIQKGLNHHPDILSKGAEAKAIATRKDQAKGGYYPSLDVRVGGGYSYVRQKIGRNSLTSSSLNGAVAQDQYTPSVSVKQMIFDGFDTSSRVEKAEKEIQQSQQKILEIKTILGYRIADAYIRLRRFERLLGLAKENIKSHQQIQAKVAKRVKEQLAGESELHAINARLHDAQTAAHDIEGDLGSARADYIALTGEEPKNIQSGAMQEITLPKTEEEALKIARKHNFSLKVATASLEVAKTDLNIVESPFYPTVHFEADGNRNHHTGTLNGWENRMSAMVVVRFNAFNGFKDTARRDEYRERATQARLDLASQQRNGDKEVRVSWAEMHSAGNQSKVLRKTVKVKKHLRSAYISEYEASKRSLIDILDAAHEYFLAKGALITADAAGDLSTIRLLASMGTLLEVVQKNA